MKYIYTNGCSFTAFVKQHPLIGDSYGDYLCKKFNCELIDESKSGSSNMGIYRRIFNWLDETDFDIIKNTMVIVQLSQMARIEWWMVEFQKYDTVHFNEVYQKEWLVKHFNFDEILKSDIKLLIGLKNTFIRYKIPYLIFRSFSDYNENILEDNKLLEYSSDKRFYKDNFFNNIVDYSDHSHPDESEHELWGNILWKYINKHGLLSYD